MGIVLQVLGGLYNPGDGHVDPYSLTQAYSVGARANGAQIVQGCDVMDTKLRSDGLWDVSTDRGVITTEHVVNCAGEWVNRSAG